MTKFFAWIAASANGLQGQPSSKRIGGYFALVVSQAVYALTIRRLIFAGHVSEVVTLTIAEFGLVATFFGLTTLEKKRGESVPEATP